LPPPQRDRARFSVCGDSRIRSVNGWRRFIQPVCFGNTARETIEGIASAAADVVFTLTRRQSPKPGGPVRGRRCGRCVHAGGATAAHPGGAEPFYPPLQPHIGHCGAAACRRLHLGGGTATRLAGAAATTGGRQRPLSVRHARFQAATDVLCVLRRCEAEWERTRSALVPCTWRRWRVRKARLGHALNGDDNAHILRRRPHALRPAGGVEAWRQLGPLFTLYSACQVCRRRWWPASSISAHAAAVVRR